jgi:hypothetical protein
MCALNVIVSHCVTFWSKLGQRNAGELVCAIGGRQFSNACIPRSGYLARNRGELAVLQNMRQAGKTLVWC